MPKAIREWELVVDLYQVRDSIKDKNQRNFVEGLYNLLDEFQPILEQQSESQVEFLYKIYRKYVGEIEEKD